MLQVCLLVPVEGSRAATARRPHGAPPAGGGGRGRAALAGAGGLGQLRRGVRVHGRGRRHVGPVRAGVRPPTTPDLTLPPPPPSAVPSAGLTVCVAYFGPTGGCSW